MKLKNSVILILLLAFALRLGGLADHSIWWDEGLAAWAARLPVERILDWTAHDVHPPLYFLLLRGWWLLVGDGEFVLRFPSVLAGTLGVALIYGLGRAMFGRRAGLFAALLLSLSAFAVSWSQEMRMYIFAAALATGALWAAYRLWQRASWQAWIAYVGACAAGLWTLYLTVTVPLLANAAFIVVYLRRGRPKSLLLRWATAQIAVVALFLPWLVYALPRIPTWSTAEPFSPLFFVHLYATMLAVGIPVNLETYTLLTALAFGVLALVLVVLWRAARSVEQRAGLSMLAGGLVLPAVVVYAVSLPIHVFYAPVLAPRYLLPLAACFYALLGLGLAALSRRHWWLGVLGTLVVVAVAINGLMDFYPGRMRHDDLISLAATIKAYVRPSDAVVLYDDKDWPLFAAQYAGEWHGIPNGAEIDGEGAAALLGPLWEESEGIWLVTTPDAQRMDPEASVRAWLERNAVASLQWDFGDHALAFYARTPERTGSWHDLGPEVTPPLGPRIQLPSATLTGAWVPVPRYETGDVLRLVLFWERPPSAGFAVEAAGPTTLDFSVPVPSPATSGLTRQQIDVVLRPDWPGGDYRLGVRDADGQVVEIGRFTLLNRVVQDRLTAADIDSPLDVRFGPSIRLLGYSLPRTKAEPGSLLDLALYWQTNTAIDARYKVFTHLLGAQYNATNGNFLWGQQDNEPQGGTLPTTAWQPDTIVIDRYSIPIAPDAPPGLYTLEIGLYGLVDGERLPVLGPRGQLAGDAAVLGQVEVTGQ